MEAEANAFRVEFPDFSCSVLQKLNQQRQLGQLCDITVVVQGRRFRAHRAVLAASSPYFCDQVLLKNSLRVTLPDVMPPAVFESLLLSCYTGALLLPAADVVAFLTAASFLQMWHVVDKCTELLEGNPAVLCQRSCPGSALPSPRSGAGDCADCEAEPPGEEGPRPLYVPPSIMCHRRWVQVKAEKPEPEVPPPQEPQGPDPERPRPAEPESQPAAEEAPAEELKGSREGEPPYDEPLDFYGASTEGFGADRAEAGGPAGGGEDCGPGAGPGGDEGAEPSPGLQEETSHSGFTAVVYKLYPCQCGKSFTHKSQRDRHMSMHLGLRPYGCGVCGKKFKMKHHLVGHMKIHTGIKPYECSICSKRFMWRDSFHRHVSSCSRAYQARRAQQAAHIC
ncbi:zinc finger and BTB domain-containing protein 43 [Lepisosteus oculatus]|uniref:zinc finger and BTB domain-containing protein 43 n=1 Tax=Lepisosteus oculatus TaxID=7918 RepID=UPI0037132BE4